MSNPSVCSILDMPDEILVMIILHFDARERLALGNSCQRFNDLVFGDEELLRHLDFTRKWQLTEKSDIQQYLNDENTYKKILRINIENVRPISSLSSSISKAINLVELNIMRGLRFESAKELACFLKPLVHLKRLSFDWPGSNMRASYYNHNWNQFFEEPFSRLTYLSLEMKRYTNEFLLILQLCQQLEELRLFLSKDVPDYGSPLHQEPTKLSNLKFVWLTGSADSGAIREHIMSIIPHPAEWTDFHLAYPHPAVYLERNIEVCAELGQVKRMPPPKYIADFRNTGSIDQGWPLVPEHLLSEVIRVTHEDAPEKFCCLDSSKYAWTQPSLLKIDEAKKLLKDPGYQMSYLHFSHLIEKNCDVHLLASVFPKLTELVLSGISNRNSTLATEMEKPLHRRLRRNGSLASKEEYSDAKNIDSSFKMLIENTPLLKVLEIFPGYREDDVEYWDLDALYLISGWRNLTVIRLRNIPITDGKFLIDIGKECKKLEEVTLHCLSLNTNCRYEIELLQMLQHCKNLRKLSIQGMSLEHLSEMLNILSNCPRLAALRLPTVNKESDPLNITSSVEEMLRQCKELKLFSINLYSHRFFRELKHDIIRMIIELNRSNFEFDLSAADLYQENFSDVFFSSPLVPFPSDG